MGQMRENVILIEFGNGEMESSAILMDFIRTKLYLMIAKLLLQNLSKSDTVFLRLEERIMSVIGFHKQNTLMITVLDDDIKSEALMTVGQKKSKHSRNSVKTVTKENEPQ